jgi:hypothetical protein
LKIKPYCDIITNVKNKSYNFTQPNYMYISKLHTTQSKYNIGGNTSKENPFLQRDGEPVTNQTIFRTESQKFSDILTTARNNSANQPLFKLAPAKETKRSEPVLTEKQISFVNRNPRFRGEITSLPTTKSQINFETNYGNGEEKDFSTYSPAAIFNSIIMMSIENAEIISDYVYKNASPDKIDLLPPVYKRLAQRIKEMGGMESLYGSIPDYIAQYKEANDTK